MRRVEGSEPLRRAGKMTTADRVFERFEKKN
jgi:hypothetical protein